MAGGRKPGLWGLHPANIKDGTFALVESPLAGLNGTPTSLGAAHGREGRGREYSNLPPALRAKMLEFGALVRQSGDPKLIAQYERWTLSYQDRHKSLRGGHVYAEALFRKKATVFFRGMLDLTEEEQLFAVAHEFRHLSERNNEIGGGDGLRSVLSNQYMHGEVDANEWAAEFLKRPIPWAFREYGIKY